MNKTFKDAAESLLLNIGVVGFDGLDLTPLTELYAKLDNQSKRIIEMNQARLTGNAEVMRLRNQLNQAQFEHTEDRDKFHDAVVLAFVRGRAGSCSKLGWQDGGAVGRQAEACAAELV